MTTLIITDKGFYSDSQVSAGDSVLSLDYEKVFCYKGRVVAMTGNPCELSSYIKKYIDGEGSGGAWAQAALDFGKTPEEAIKYAMTKDIYTGGKVKKVIFSKNKGN